MFVPTSRFSAGLIAVSALWILEIFAGASAQAQTAWYEGFEGPETSWRPAGGDAQHRMELHKRVQGEAHTGDGCERLRVAGLGGTRVYISHAVGRARVIDELLPTLWVKSDRSGLQILARVVLPRTEDPRTGQALATLIQGSSYTKVGHWQQLRISDIPRQVTRQVRIVRSQLGPGVDGREAYVDGILLNVYGGPGITNVWIDDLDVGGYVAAQPAPASTGGAGGGDGWREASASPPLANSAAGAPAGGPRGKDRDGPRLVRSVLMVDGRETFPRVIQHQGEPLAFLKRLGFNAVWLPKLPSPALLAEARQLGLWLVCPPPVSPGGGVREGSPAPPPEIGPEYDCVLAWDLGVGTAAEDLQRIKKWSERVRRADRWKGRPLVCRPGCELRAWSRYVSLLWIDRPILGASLTLTDYGRWLRQRPLLARPGTPIWTSVQTQPVAALRQQWALLGRGQPLPGTVSPEQIRLLTYTAVAAGSRGLIFGSDTPLDRTDPDTRARAAILELLNLELSVIEPWTAAGGRVASVSGKVGPAGGSHGEVVGAVLRTDRARLLVPIWSAPGAQFVAGQSAANRVSLLVPGVPEAHNAYELVPGRLRPLRRQRVTGGVQVTLDEFGLTGAVLLTQDPLAISSTTQRAQRIGRRAAELRRELAVWKSQTVAQVYQQLSTTSGPAANAATYLAAANYQLRQSGAMLAARDYAAADACAQRAMRPLRLLERTYWEAAVKSVDAPVASPAAVCFRTLPWHQAMMALVASAGLGPNRLIGGDCEDLQVTLDSGWRHAQFPVTAVRAEAELSPAAARSGGFGLRLAAEAVDPANPPELIESPPVWITTHAVPVETGELIRIHGWVRVPEPITGSVDGLMIVDSLSGEILARRIHQTRDWQPFTLYRVAPQAGRMSVSFLLTGLGEAWLDDVTIQPVQPIQTLGITRLPQGPGGFTR